MKELGSSKYSPLWGGLGVWWPLVAEQSLRLWPIKEELSDR